MTEGLKAILRTFIKRIMSSSESSESFQTNLEPKILRSNSIIMSSSESSDSSQPEVESNEQPTLRRSNRIKQMEKRKRRLTEEQPTDTGKIKRMRTLYTRQVSECMSSRLEDLELEHQEKEQEMGRLLEAASEELLRLQQQNGNGQGSPLCVCTEFNGELFKLYDLPEDVEFHIPKKSRHRHRKG
ncbi:uncharacterized protein LOC6579747 [Drosophila mojavensis]|uniref:Uncharacterized protein n=1 Tax=Drosophila mojavensis TaxID=7230 RepID=A0A0Q9XIN4_DROMO|nr:uncharacterized protein LOC6579747 [Drosophila mojavensis]XP_043867057.1 uncharacterized protein LOC6579747 [Drosophila mojavensis]KRG04734.1 uncharacterized protein Dmoj_GI18967 [Drosophila mojavensis]